MSSTSNNLVRDGAPMVEQGVQEQHLRIKVPLNQDVHIPADVLCAGAGVMDVDRLNFESMQIKSVDVHGHENHPVGVSVKLPGNGLVGTTHRETYVSCLLYTSDAADE